MGFSLYLTINHPYYSFGDVVIRQQCDGYGISGAVTSQLTVSISAAEYEEKKPESNAKVQFTVRNGKTEKEYVFYVANRRRSGGKVTFTCYDKMAFTDMYIDSEKLSFPDGYITAHNLVHAIAEQCGIEQVDSGIDSMGFFGVLPFYPEDIYGKTGRTLLEEISKAWCGYFKVTYSNTLWFVPFGTGTVTGNIITQHTAISKGSEKGPITKIKTQNGDKVFAAGEEKADTFQTLTVNTSFASQELADALLERTKNATYKSWNCSKADLPSDILPDITADIAFKGEDNTSLLANNITLNFTSGGIYFSGGGNDVTENEFEYIGALSRKINERIKDGEKLGNNTMVTRYQGIIHLPPESDTEAQSGENSVKGYGYSPADRNGIVQFDGAMVSKIVPSSASINADKTEAVVSYGDKSFRYKIQWDGNNISGFKKEEIPNEF